MTNTNNLKLNFGKYKGERWTRIPISYLRWLINEKNMSEDILELAESELARRGTILEKELELSSHAINRASTITGVWKTQGVYNWLYKISKKALKIANGKEIVLFNGFKFCFKYGEYYPILKTIINLKK